MSKLFMKYEMQLLHLNRAMFSSKIDSLPDDISTGRGKQRQSSLDKRRYKKCTQAWNMAVIFEKGRTGCLCSMW